MKASQLVRLQFSGKNDFMKFAGRGIAVAIALFVTTSLVATASASAVSADSWTESHTHYNVYFDGGYASHYFAKPQTQLPDDGTITNVSYQVAPYDNGNSVESVELCFQRQYETEDFRCQEITVTGSSTLSTSAFDGLDPEGTFVITHYLYGGTYPASGGTAQDTVTVEYQY